MLWGELDDLNKRVIDLFEVVEKMSFEEGYDERLERLALISSCEVISLL